MWREFLWKIGRPSSSPRSLRAKKTFRNRNSNEDSSSSESISSQDSDEQSDSSGISGHYSFQHIPSQLKQETLQVSSDSEILSFDQSNFRTVGIN